MKTYIKNSVFRRLAAVVVTWAAVTVISFAEPVLFLTETDLSATFSEGISPAPLSFLIANEGDGTLNYSISSDVSWLNPDPQFGSITTEFLDIDLEIYSEALSVGSYTGTVTVFAHAATGSPQDVKVILEVTKAESKDGIIFDTSYGAGADAYINNQSQSQYVNYGSATELVIRNDGDNAFGWHRHTYLRFDLSGIQPTVTNATLGLTLTFNTLVNNEASIPEVWEIEIYGLVDSSSGNAWDESSISWNNAPGNNTGGNGFTSDFQYLGNVSIEGAVVGDRIRFSGANLVNFLNNDTDGLVTFGLRRANVQRTDSSFLIASKEHSVYEAPSLALNQKGVSVPFGSGGNAFSMRFVEIGHSGNIADTTGYGAVGYDYKIGKYEVAADQWASALASDPNIGNATPSSSSKPATHTSWLEAAKFANWLTSSNAYDGAYQFDSGGALTNVLTRNQILATGGTFYLLPTEDEWYKAAYFKPDGSGYTIYPSGDSVPPNGSGGQNYNGSVWDVGTGGIENNGTYDMSANVWEWTESAFDGLLDNFAENRAIRGGAFYYDASFMASASRLQNPPETSYFDGGFRIALIGSVVPLPPPVISVRDVLVYEKAGAAEIEVVLSHAANSPVQVDFQTLDQSAIDGLDYVGTNGTLTIPAGDLSGYVDIRILDDALTEGNEDFRFEISNPIEGLISNGVAVITITETNIIRLGCTVAVFDDPAYVDTGNTYDAESDNLQAALVDLGFTVTTFTGTNLSDWVSAFSVADVVVIPELEKGDLAADLSTSTLGEIATQMGNGKGLLLFPDYYGPEHLTDLCNGIFGWNLVKSSNNFMGEGIGLEPGVPAGFSTAPPNLSAWAGIVTFQRSSLPAGAQVLYAMDSDANAVAGFIDGKSAFLSWDWYDPTLDDSNGSTWKQVLGLVMDEICGN